MVRDFASRGEQRELADRYNQATWAMFLRITRHRKRRGIPTRNYNVVGTPMMPDLEGCIQSLGGICGEGYGTDKVKGDGEDLHPEMFEMEI